MHNTDARSAGEMPAGNMADFNGQPGLTIGVGEDCIQRDRFLVY